MMPYDGSGYGKSSYWEWQLKSIARNNGEWCPCWENKTPLLKFKSDDDVIRLKIKCLSKSILCKQCFPNTEKALKELFIKMYKD